MIIDVTRTVVERVEIPDEEIIKYAKEDIINGKKDDSIEYISGYRNGSFEGQCETLLEEIGYDQRWERFDSRKEVFEEFDAYDIYADIKDKDAVIAELVELIKGEQCAAIIYIKTGARNISKNELKFLPQGTIRNFILKNELEKWDSFTIPFLDILLKKCTVLIKLLKKCTVLIIT